jgi:hypothetical protein
MNRPGIRLSLMLLCLFMSNCPSSLEFAAVSGMRVIFTSITYQEAVLLVRLLAWCSACQFVGLHWPTITRNVGMHFKIVVLQRLGVNGQ